MQIYLKVSRRFNSSEPAGAEESWELGRPGFPPTFSSRPVSSGAQQYYSQVWGSSIVSHISYYLSRYLISHISYLIRAASESDWWSVLNHQLPPDQAGPESSLCIPGPAVVLTTLSCSCEDNSPGPGPRQDTAIRARDIKTASDSNNIVQQNNYQHSSQTEREWWVKIERILWEILKFPLEILAHWSVALKLMDLFDFRKYID